ncbi:MAG: hypothetical protein DRI86_08725 [Bacteroidetes bacterium]|nr:MAG: hypothetical protein DRI86_08725 [Bacteroidota bacterium]
MNELFYVCVKILQWLGAVTGTTYEEINIIVFVIIGPIVFFLLLIALIRCKFRVKKQNDKIISN